MVLSAVSGLREEYGRESIVYKILYKSYIH